MKHVFVAITGLVLVCGVWFASPAPQAVADEVKEKIVLFNGKDMTNFYTWLGKRPNTDAAMKLVKDYVKGSMLPEEKQKDVLAGLDVLSKSLNEPYGMNRDPLKVFGVVTVDGQPAIRVSGEVFGGFTTEKDYENYHLVVEFKWGEKTFAPREKAARDSGILLHCVGKDGAAGGVWMESIECQMIEGGTGDIILVGGKSTPKITVKAEKRGQWYFNPKAEPKEFTGGRINWYDRDPDWKDVKGFRGKLDVENPVGEWNKLECVCAGDKLTYILNGKVVNEGTNASLTKGKILFQSEGAEVFFRKIELLPLTK